MRVIDRLLLGSALATLSGPSRRLSTTSDCMWAVSDGHSRRDQDSSATRLSHRQLTSPAAAALRATAVIAKQRAEKHTCMRGSRIEKGRLEPCNGFRGSTSEAKLNGGCTHESAQKQSGERCVRSTLVGRPGRCPW